MLMNAGQCSQTLVDPDPADRVRLSSIFVGTPTMWSVIPPGVSRMTAEEQERWERMLPYLNRPISQHLTGEHG